MWIDAALLAKVACKGRWSARVLSQRRLLGHRAAPAGRGTGRTVWPAGDGDGRDARPGAGVRPAAAGPGHGAPLRAAARRRRPLTGVIADPFDLDRQTWWRAQAGAAPAAPLHRAPGAAVRHPGLSVQPGGIGARGRYARRQRCRRAARRQRPPVLSFASVSEAASPAVKLVNSTLYDALKAGARDIHLESTARASPSNTASTACSTTSASVGGVELAEQVISRLKVLAELDIAERRVPQDGSFRVASRAGARSTCASRSCRACTARTRCIRILDKQAHDRRAAGALTPGCARASSAELVERLRRLSQQPYGMLLVTGPTGSRQDHDPVRRASPRSTPAATRSSRSRTRSSTSCPASCKSRSTRRRA